MSEYRMAEYYDGTKHYAAARLHYSRVAKQFPQTDLGAQSQARMAEIAEEPDEPPQRMGFLLDMVPQSREKARFAKIPEIQQGKTRVAQSLGQENGQGGVTQASGTTTR
jgi:hypothetical protein